jgi:hypothetical protein
MDIQANMDVIFSNIHNTSKPIATKPVKGKLNKNEGIATQEAKQLEFNLNNHLKSKYKAQERVSFISPQAKVDTYTSIETLITQDIEKRKGNTNWNTMNICDKWAKVKEYYHQNNTKFNESSTKKLLLSGKLNVIYDKDKKQISEISHL